MPQLLSHVLLLLPMCNFHVVSDIFTVSTMLPFLADRYTISTSRFLGFLIFVIIILMLHDFH